jgi:hypothetical protein
MQRRLSYGPDLLNVERNMDCCTLSSSLFRFIIATDIGPFRALAVT